MSGSEHLSLTDSERAQLVYAFCRNARQQGLSRAVTERYQAWTFVFAAWCHEHPPHRVGAGRIGAFRQALQRCDDASQEEVHEAMDALAFLFGAADDAASLLSTAEPEAQDASSAVDEEASSGESIQTLQVGWRDGSDAFDGSVQAPHVQPKSASAPTVETDRSGDTEPSVAETCVERFQTQVDSLHGPDADASESPEPETAPDQDAPSEPVAPSR